MTCSHYYPFELLHHFVYVCTNWQGCIAWIIMTATPLPSLSVKLMAPYTNAPLCCRGGDTNQNWLLYVTKRSLYCPSAPFLLSTLFLQNRSLEDLPSDLRSAQQSWIGIWPGWWPIRPPAAPQPHRSADPSCCPAAPSKRRPWSAGGPQSKWARQTEEEIIRWDSTLSASCFSLPYFRNAVKKKKKSQIQFLLLF